MKSLDDQQEWELLLYTNKKYEAEPTITFMLDLDSKTPSVTVSGKKKKKQCALSTLNACKMHLVVTINDFY